MSKPIKGRFFAACYGFPVSIRWEIRVHKDVAKEGGYKPACKTCVRIALKAIKEDITSALRLAKD